MKWGVKNNSRISQLPSLVRPPALILRSAYQSFRRMKARASYHSQDGIRTMHNVGFMRKPSFRHAYETAVATAGKDYGIPYRIHQAIWCSHQAQKVMGDYVELGTGRGFVMSAVLSAFPKWEDSNRDLYLLDTFRPNALNEDGKQPELNEHLDYYAISFEDTRIRFEKWSNVHLVPGDIFDTLLNLDLQNIAFLHIDLNYYRPEVWALEHLWDVIPRGGMVLLDDYACKGRTRQFDEMNMLARKLHIEILSTPTGQGIIVK